MDFIKCSKSAKEDYNCCPLFSSLCFPLSSALSLHTLNDFRKGLWSSKALFFMNLSFQKLFHELYTALPQSWIALVIKKLSKHQNLTQFD